MKKKQDELYIIHTSFKKDEEDTKPLQNTYFARQYEKGFIEKTKSKMVIPLNRRSFNIAMKKNKCESKKQNGKVYQDAKKVRDEVKAKNKKEKKEAQRAKRLVRSLRKKGYSDHEIFLELQAIKYKDIQQKAFKFMEW